MILYATTTTTKIYKATGARSKSSVLCIKMGQKTPSTTTTSIVVRAIKEQNEQKLFELFKRTAAFKLIKSAFRSDAGILLRRVWDFLLLVTRFFSKQRLEKSP